MPKYPHLRCPNKSMHSCDHPRKSREHFSHFKKVPIALWKSIPLLRPTKPLRFLEQSLLKNDDMSLEGNLLFILPFVSHA